MYLHTLIYLFLYVFAVLSVLKFLLETQHFCIDLVSITLLNSIINNNLSVYLLDFYIHSHQLK